MIEFSDYRKMINKQKEQKRRQIEITYVASQLPLDNFVVIATTLENADFYSLLNPKRGKRNTDHRVYGTVNYGSDNGRFIMLDYCKTEEIALKTAKEYREKFQSETPDFGPPLCSCNQLKMIETSEGFVCPHMRELSNKEQLEWQKLNDIPKWLCKLKPSNY